MNIQLRNRHFDLIAVSTIVIFACIPLLFNFPYRVNIFLSYEGAYRIYQGQMPFKDFALPMGYGYWLLPALFFKLFGPYLASLIKAQVLINVLSGLAFWQIMRSLEVKPSLRSLAVLVYCISYSFFNFWPWYNHTVIVYQFIGLALLLTGIFSESKYNWTYIAGAALFAFLSFFTKQDGGGLGLLIMLSLLVADLLYSRKIKNLLVYLISIVLIGVVFIVPLLKYDFGYWFNLGQEPHNSRLAIKDFIDIIFGESQWIKFYLLLIGLSIIGKIKDFKGFLKDKKRFMIYLLTIAIMVEALLFQVTSYTPPDNNIFFHSFGFLFLITQFNFELDFSKLRIYLSSLLLVLIWWSGVYWKYVDRIIKRAIPEYGQEDPDKISVKTFVIKENSDNVGMDQWVFSPLKSFKKVYMPESTVKGINRIMSLEVLRDKENPRVLNMTELTPLANEVPFELETGLPLWYHEGVGMFEKQTNFFIHRIENNYYDVILFETIPYLNNFFPEKVREAAIKNYRLDDRFLAPRRPTDSHIEVYIKKEE